LPEHNGTRQAVVVTLQYQISARWLIKGTKITAIDFNEQQVQRINEQVTISHSITII
jgi:hypothetical protein